LTTFVNSGFALTEANPYSPIVGRNVFALKPPTPVNNTPVAPVIAAPGIELQGITTILGRPQVLLKIKLPPRPPEPAKDQSFVLDVGQREGDVEVLSIDMASGTVQLKNQGNDLALNMKDNASKPTAGPALPGAIMPPVNQMPGLIPAPAPVPNAGASGASVTTIGSPSTLPTRALRGNPTGPGMAGAGNTGMGQNQPQQRELSAEEGAALLEINRKLHEGKGLPFPPPRVNLDQ
jgi:hypothetical protein